MCAVSNFSLVMANWEAYVFQVGNGELPEIVVKRGVRVAYDCVLVPKAYRLHTLRLAGVMCSCGFSRM